MRPSEKAGAIGAMGKRKVSGTRAHTDSHSHRHEASETERERERERGRERERESDRERKRKRERERDGREPPTAGHSNIWNKPYAEIFSGSDLAKLWKRTLQNKISENYLWKITHSARNSRKITQNNSRKGKVYPVLGVQSEKCFGGGVRAGQNFFSLQ